MTDPKRPLRIGMSACFFHADPQRAIFKGKTLLYMEQSMAEMVLREGALIYMLPSIPTGWNADTFLEDLDGLLLQGGSDLAPESYGETPLRPEWKGDRIRDIYEMELMRAAMDLDRPILGACRGFQVINVALGGSLWQDITTQVEDTLVHRNWDIYDQNFHSITFEEGAKMRDMYPGHKSGTTNSVHHQGVKELAPDLVVEAISDADGIVEAFRYAPKGKDEASCPYIYAVQWHPEFISPDDEALLSPRPIVQDFLNACQKRRDQRMASQD